MVLLGTLAVSLFEDIFPDTIDISKLPPPAEHAKWLLDRADNDEHKRQVAQLVVPSTLEQALSLTMMNRWEQARFLFEFALAICKESGEWRLELDVCAHFGSACIEAEWYAEAEVTFTIMRVLAHGKGERERESDAISHLAVVCHKQGLRKEALALMDEALAVDRSPSNLGMLAQLLNDAGRFAEAAGHLHEVVQASRKGGDFVEETLGHAQLGRCYAEGGNLSLAAEHFRIALEGIPKIFGYISGYEEQALLLDKLQDIFEEYVATLMTLHRADSTPDRAAEAFRVAEFGRARSLIGFLQGRNPSISAEALTIAQLQGALDDRTVLLEYVLCTKASYVWAVTNTHWEVHEIPGKETILTDVAHLLSAITKLGTDWKRLAQALRRVLIQPVQELIEDILGKLPVGESGRLIISSDYWMTALPFEVLIGPLGDERESGFLLSRCAVTYTASATSAMLLQEVGGAMSKTWRHNLIAFAPVAFTSAQDLPNTESELAQIASAFESSSPHRGVALKLGRDASKDAVRKASFADYRYVHFATHGHLDGRGGYFCGLLLAGQGHGVDEVLHAYEIAHLEMSCDLVTASACETAIGRAFRGEGMMSLAHAFLKAGVPSACVSLWKVSDQSTAELMRTFYGYLTMGRCDKAEALRRAKLDLMDRNQWRHPFYWAPFILFGHWR